MNRARTAVKFFVYGLIVGLLFAPRKGEETRQELINWAMGTVQETINSVTGSSSSSETTESTDQSS